MKCLYYLSPNLDVCKKVSNDLHDIGVDDWYLHVISKDESGLTQQHIHSSNYLETLDLYRGTTVGGALGFVISLVIIAAMATFEPFGPGVPGYVYMIILAVTTLFGIWEGGLYGIDTENQKIAPFHEQIEAGKYLVLVYTDKKQGEKISQMMGQRHPESELVASDTHYINPFSKLKLV